MTYAEMLDDEKFFTKRFSPRTMLLRGLKAWEGNLPGFDSRNVWLNGNYRQIAYLCMEYVLRRKALLGVVALTEEEDRLFRIYEKAYQEYRGDLEAYCLRAGEQSRKNYDKHLKRIMDRYPYQLRAKTDSYWIVYLTNEIWCLL